MFSPYSISPHFGGGERIETKVWGKLAGAIHRSPLTSVGGSGLKPISNIMCMPNKHSDTFCRGWHPDGTPFAPKDYREAGLPVPTPAQLAFWAESDAEQAAERAAERRARYAPVRIFHQNKD